MQVCVFVCVCVCACVRRSTCECLYRLRVVCMCVPWTQDYVQAVSRSGDAIVAVAMAPTVPSYAVPALLTEFSAWLCSHISAWTTHSGLCAIAVSSV